MAFQPAPHETITIGATIWRVAEHPAAPGQPYVRAGGQATVYRLEAGGDDGPAESRALKVFGSDGRTAALVTQAGWLADHTDLPGLAVSQRHVLTPNRDGVTIAQHPDLQFAVLMPWIDGPTWADVIAQRYVLPAGWSLALAHSLVMMLAQLEQQGLAHCQLSGANLVLPGLVGQSGGDTASHPVALVDIEALYAPSLTAPAATSPTSPAYRHPVTGVSWTADADRFPGALLLSEMLGWCDEQVRAAAFGDTYFDPAEMQQSGARATLLNERVHAWWGPAVAGLLDRAWRSPSPAGCPTFAEWAHVLPSAAPQAPTFTAPVVAAGFTAATVASAALPVMAPAGETVAEPVAMATTVAGSGIAEAITTPSAEPAAAATAITPSAPRPRPTTTPRRGVPAVAIAVLAVASITLLVALAGGAWLLRPTDTSPTAVAAKPTAVAAVPTAAAVATTAAVTAPASATRPAATIAAGAVATPAPSPATTAAPSGAATPAAAAGGSDLVILYSSHSPDEHDSQIWIMDLDGGRKRPLTFTRGHSWAPRLAPDGRRFLFSSVAPGAHTSHDPTGGGTSTSPGNHDIYVGDADGSNITNVTSAFNSWDNGWSWSPDGKWIAFSSDRDGNWELYKMTATGESITRLTNDAKSDGWPAWTPDGKSIIFASDRTGNWELFSMSDTGASVKQLTERPTTYDTFPAISPDGKTIVFSSQVPGRNEGEIYAIAVDGTGLTRLTSTVAMNNLPTWCPDGRIVFVSDRAGNDDIWIMNRDGSNATRLTANRGEDTTPSCGRRS